MGTQQATSQASWYVPFTGFCGVVIGALPGFAGILVTQWQQAKRDRIADERALRNAKHERLRASYVHTLAALHGILDGLIHYRTSISLLEDAADESDDQITPTRLSEFVPRVQRPIDEISALLLEIRNVQEFNDAMGRFVGALDEVERRFYRRDIASMTFEEELALLDDCIPRVRKTLAHVTLVARTELDQLTQPR